LVQREGKNPERGISPYKEKCRIETTSYRGEESPTPGKKDLEGILEKKKRRGQEEGLSSPRGKAAPTKKSSEWQVFPRSRADQKVRFPDL